MTFAGDFLTEKTERQSPYNVIQIASIMLKKTLSILSPLGGYNLDNVWAYFLAEWVLLPPTRARGVLLVLSWLYNVAVRYLHFNNTLQKSFKAVCNVYSASWKLFSLPSSYAPGVYSSSGKSSIKFRAPQNISDDLPTLKGAIALTLKIQDISDLFSY